MHIPIDNERGSRSKQKFIEDNVQLSHPDSQLYILVMCVSQAGLEGYWGYHSQADNFGRRCRH